MDRLPALPARLTCLALLALGGATNAQAADLLPPPPASTCAAPTVPTQPGDIHMFPGRWWNPQRNGIGWDFFYNDGQDRMYLTWFTYDQNGRPVWLHGEAASVVFNAVTGERTWQSRLHAVRWNRNGIRTFSEVGQVSATFPNQTTTRAAIAWKWDVAQPGGHPILPVGPGTYSECLLDTYRDPMSPNPQLAAKALPELNQAYSSNWFYYNPTGAEHPLGGWGVDLLIDLNPHDNQYYETATAAIFDDANRPAWVQSVDNWGTNPPPGTTFGTADKGQLRYIRHRPVAAGEHPATKACFLNPGDANDKCVFQAHAGNTVDGTPTGTPTNYFRREIDSARQGNMQLKVDVPDSATRNGGPIDAARIAWPPADNATPFPPTLPVMHYDSNHIIVDKTICRVTAGQTCAFTVSWVSDDFGAQIRRIDLNNNGAVSSQIASGAGGDFVETLNIGDRFQYQIVYTMPGYPPVTLRTPEVRVLLDGAIADQNVEPADCASGPGCDLGTHDPSAGAIAGTAEADGGAASYNIPIVMPPGRAGMQPQVALSYSSRGGNSIAGMGWSIGGLSSIHRCPRTVAQDGAASPVTLSQNDALCLDGQRLVATSGTYGTAGATYRTEIDSFARVTQVGGSLTGHATCFKVEDKSGRVSHYGAVASGGCSAIHGDARVLPQGGAATLSWLIKKTEDRIATPTGGGNNIVYNYVQHGAGELLINDIRYTGFGNTQGSRYVTFAYQARPDNDRSSSYIAGGLTEQTQRLAEITSRDDVLPSTTYLLTYQEPIAQGQTSLHSGRSNLQKVEMCSGGSCLQPTTVFWNDAPPDHAFHAFDFGSVLPASVTPSTGNAEARRIVPLGDLDGDGSRELVVVQHQADSQFHTWLVKYSADRVFQQALELNLLGSDPVITETTPQADIDGDGRSDLVNPASTGTLAFNVWTGARGAGLGGQTQGTLFRTIATNVPWQPNADQIVASEDVNGDGHVDLVALKIGSDCNGALAAPVQTGPRTLCVFANQTKRALASNETSYAFAAGVPVRTMAYLSERYAHSADINGDGISEHFFNEVYSVGGGARIYHERLKGVLVSKPAGTPGIVACGTTGSTYYQDCTTTALNLRTTSNAANAGTFDDDGAVPYWTDVNGDGLTDLLFATVQSCMADNTTASMWCIQLATGTGFTNPIQVTGGHEALQIRPHMPTSPTFTNAGRMPTHDINSDGKAEVLYPAALAARICQRVLANYPPGPDSSCDIPQASQCQVVGMKQKSILADAKSNCQAEIVMCGDDPSGQYPLPNHGGVGGENTMAVCGQYSFNADKLGGISGLPDFSSYVMKALRFEQTGPNAFRAVSVDAATSGPSTPSHKLVAQSGRSPAYSIDVYGDGLADLVTTVGCGNGTASTTPCVAYTAAGEGPAALPDGTSIASLLPSASDPTLGRKIFVNENVGAAENVGNAPILPELARGIQNGMGARSFWNYAPLSSKAGRAADKLPLYEIVPGEATYADANHFYFQSTMPVVSTFTSSNGVGDIGFRSWRYGYREAIYNHAGRGFQGFRAITKEQIPLSGDVPRSLRTTTTFHQKFPLTSRIEKVETGKPRGVRDISVHTRETYDWRCNVLDRGACDTLNGAAPAHFPYALTQTTTTFDATAAEADSEVAVAEVLVRNYDEAASGAGLDTYGNPTFSETVAKDLATDTFGFGRFVESKRTRETNTYFPHDTTTWWTDKLQRNVKTIFPIVWGTTHPLPVDASTAQQSVETVYGWNSNRTPQSIDVQPNAGDTQRLHTEFEYAREYGLPTAVKRYSKPTDSQPEGVRITSTAYGADGYFPITVTEVVDTNNWTGLTTEVSHRSKDGQVDYTRSPTGTTTTNFYDAFGRLTRSEARDANAYFSLQPANITWNRCSSGVCGNLVGNGGKRSDGLSAEQFASYTVTTVQNGHATKVAWFDALGREIKTATRGHDGTFSATLIEYDAMGTIVRQSVPFYLADANASSPANTVFTYDRAGRPTSKRVETKPGVPLLDPAGGNVLTDYTYTGNRTDVFVRGANVAACMLPNVSGDSRCMRMQRYAGVLGMMRTVDAQGGVTRYWSDAAGRGVAIADVKANADAGSGAVAAGRSTRATYDELGRRTASSDPNQGTWTFVYNGYGELRRQTDARGAITTVENRDALGRTLAQTAYIPGNGMQVTPGLSRIAMRDESTYDVLGQLVEARRCKRQDVTGQPPLSCTYTDSAWGEAYVYDAAGRIASIRQTQLVYGLQRKTETTKFHYDANFGREKAVEFPSGLRVQRIFTRWGTLRDVLDADTGTRFWGVASTDAWGNVTRQDYGNGMRGDYTWSPVSGQSLTRQWRSGLVDPSPVTEKVSYAYDSLGNLKSQTRDASGAGGTAATETYVYDSLQRLKSATPTTAAAVNYDYDAAGNFTHKSDFSAPGGYQYSTSPVRGCGPNAAHTVALKDGGGTTLYTCDANGNITASMASLPTDRVTDYDVTNRPQHVLLASTPTDAEAFFAYSPSGERTYELLVEAYVPTSGGIMQRRNQLVLRGPRGYALEQLYDTAANGGWSDAVMRHEIGDASVVLKATDNTNGTGQGKIYEVSYKATDRLGSPLGLMDKTGSFTRSGPNNATISTRRSFDAFGKARESNFSERPTTALNPIVGQLNLLPETRDGFTGHEHLDSLGLIHMNGRAYDYQLGRFISVDPFVQFPANSQSLNPYSYILNNPLSAKDPTGYQVDAGSVCARGAGVCGASMGTDGLTAMQGSQLVQLQIRFVVSSGADSIGVCGAPSTPSSGPDVTGIGNAEGSLLKRAQDAVFPHTAYLEKEGVAGTFLEKLSGGAKAGITGMMDLADAANPVSRFMTMLGFNPRPTVQPGEALGAAVFEWATFIPGGAAKSGASVGARVTSKLDAAMARGISTTWGYFFPPVKNAAGGEVHLSIGLINQQMFQDFIDSAKNKGWSVDIISGVHGYRDGSTKVDSSMFEFDRARFESPEFDIRVHNYPDLNDGQLRDILNNRSGTVIGGFCDSNACLSPLLDPLD
ncbi:MAG TPA: RHS repeat-associated core domain-containing protein [Tahibacter sp.]|nr:RHS repeat-associated core domain-containing protein [Tahibacter sp.]